MFCIIIFMGGSRICFGWSLLYEYSNNFKQNGPEEILNHGKNGLLFDNNNKKSLLEALKRFENLTEKELKQFKINAKKKSKKFTMFNHYKLLIQILKIYE